MSRDLTVVPAVLAENTICAVAKTVGGIPYRTVVAVYGFLPRCMECRRGLAMRIPSVPLSVRPSVRQTREL